MTGTPTLMRTPPGRHTPQEVSHHCYCWSGRLCERKTLFATNVVLRAEMSRCSSSFTKPTAFELILKRLMVEKGTLRHDLRWHRTTCNSFRLFAAAALALLPVFQLNKPRLECSAVGLETSSRRSVTSVSLCTIPFCQWSALLPVQWRACPFKFRLFPEVHGSLCSRYMSSRTSSGRG